MSSSLSIDMSRWTLSTVYPYGSYTDLFLWQARVDPQMYRHRLRERLELW